MQTKLTLICESCFANRKPSEIDFNRDSYEEHIKKYHSKKVNVKNMFFNCSILREIVESNHDNMQ